MRGWMIVNSFLRSGKFSEHSEWMKKCAEDMGIELTIMGNAEVLPVLGGNCIQNPPDFVLFWDKDIRLAKTLEAEGMRLFNSAAAIEKCDDKYACFLALSGKGDYLLPKTAVAPMTYENIGYTDYGFLGKAEELFGFPMVVKECYGSFGEQVYLAGNRDELYDIMKRCGSRPVLFQQYIAASRGVDLRLQVVGEQVVCAMKRCAAGDDFRANLSLGGRMEAYTPDREECRIALEVCRVLRLDFAGVDLLLDKERRYVCEVNSNAHFKRIAACTGVDVGRCILEHIHRQIK